MQPCNAQWTTPGQMTGEQAAKLKRLAQAAYELDAFKPTSPRAETDPRIATFAGRLLVGRTPNLEATLSPSAPPVVPLQQKKSSLNQGTRPKLSGAPQSGTRPELRFRRSSMGREAEQWIVD